MSILTILVVLAFIGCAVIIWAVYRNGYEDGRLIQMEEDEFARLDRIIERQEREAKLGND